MNNIISQLQIAIPRERILSRYIDRISYASDAGFYHLLPKIVVRPNSDDEVKYILQTAVKFQLSVTFRTGGTSLSGQSVTDGILVDLSKSWRNISISEHAKTVTVQPGIIGHHVNMRLKPFGRKIGPDPASIQAAQIGGILANNSSGMCCGVADNAYHTLESVRFILADGKTYQSNNATDRLIFSDTELASNLLDLKKQIESNAELTGKIRRKYRLKNTIGYGLNSFLDFTHPMDIFSHLLIGSEGTLAFISEATLRTLPDKPNKLTGLIYFDNLYAACQAIQPFSDMGAVSLELMDYASLLSVAHRSDVPSELKNLPKNYCAILFEFQDDFVEGIEKKQQELPTLFSTLPHQLKVSLTTNSSEQATLWKIRKELFPSIGAVRKSGTTVIIEDLVFPVPVLADAVVRLRELFIEHHYPEAIIFGHAKDGNIHFVITQAFSTRDAITQYQYLMDDVVRLVVNEFGGSLKGEHGTGRNMSPFVETEWGKDAYDIMKRIKQVADPNNILNRGVIINDDPLSHLHHLKTLTPVNSQFDRCMECGFCEPQCPSKDLTLTPRQRIMILREIERLGNSSLSQELLDDFQYDGIDTCATDGLCSLTCPVDIDTGKIVKSIRSNQNSKIQKKLSLLLANHFNLTTSVLRKVVQVGHFLNQLLGKNALVSASQLFRNFFPNIPQWLQTMPLGSSATVFETTTSADFLYFQTCITRMMGGYSNNLSVSDTLQLLAKRAQISIKTPKKINSLCCGTPFSSKGYHQVAHTLINQTIEALYAESNNGKIPIISDTSPCTYSFKNCYYDLTEENKRKYSTLTFLDSTEFALDYLLPNLPIKRKLNHVAVFAVCSTTKMDLESKLIAAAKQCAEEVISPMNGKCCGMAGDRGLLFPELPLSANQELVNRFSEQQVEACFSTSRLCEAQLSFQTGKDVLSLFHLLEKVSRSQEK